jgi:TolB-like protein/Flp pilus assembly protein TadD
VEHVLAGTAGQLKEYLIGTVVFDRRSDYDPRVDPIVRVEARRLRKRLKAYYSAEGQSDTIEISIPTGSYVPVLSGRSPVPAQGEQALQAQSSGLMQPGMTGLAVLPFANLNADRDEDFFSDGLAEEVLRLLAGVHGLRVVAWHSASQLRGRDHDYQAIHQQLKVEHILRGSVRRAGDRVRVTTHLVNAANGSIQWSDVFDRDMPDVLSLQETIAQSIVEALKLNLALRQAGAGPGVSRSYSESHRLCLMGRFELNKRTPAGLRKAVEYFDQASALEPDNALAHAQSANACTLLCQYSIVRPIELMHRAKASALRALSIDEGLVEAHTALAMITAFYEWNWCEAEALFRRAINLNPNHAEARLWLGSDVLGLQGKMAEGLEQVRLALHLDPLSLPVRESQGYFLMLMRDFEAALAFHQESIQLTPESHRGYTGSGRVLALMGRYDEAIANFRQARVLTPDLPAMIGAMGQVLGEAGHEEEARACIKDLELLAPARFVPCTAFALIHLGLGEKDRALSYLEQGCRQREFSVATLKVHPIFDRLRGEPRAERLIARMNLLRNIAGNGGRRDCS